VGSWFRADVGFETFSGMAYWRKFEEVKGVFPSQSM
jgi:hypothetical protein